MPQLTRPIPNSGHLRTTPFKHGQRVLLSNDKVFLKAVVLNPSIKLNCDEILRIPDMGVLVEVGNQEGFEGFKWDLSNCNRHVTICYSTGVWHGHVHCTCYSGETLEIELREC